MVACPNCQTTFAALSDNLLTDTFENDEKKSMIDTAPSLAHSASAATGASFPAERGAEDVTQSIDVKRSNGWRYLSLPWLISLITFGFLPWCEISCNGDRYGIVPRISQSGYQALYGGYSTPFPSIVEDEIRKDIEKELKADRGRLQKQLELDRSYLTSVSPFLIIFWGSCLILSGVVCFVPLSSLRLRFSLILCGLLLVVMVIHAFAGLPLERRVELALAQDFRDNPDRALFGLMVLRVGKTAWFWLVLVGAVLLASTEFLLNRFKAERWLIEPRDWITPGFITCMVTGLALLGCFGQFAAYKHELDWKETLLASHDKTKREAQRRYESEQRRLEDDRLAEIRRQEAEAERLRQQVALEKQKTAVERERRLREQEAEESRRQKQKEQDDLRAAIEKRKAAAEAKKRAEQEVREKAEREAEEAKRRAEQARIDSEEVAASKLLRTALRIDARGGFDEHVRERLKEIIDKYPDTPSAAKAKEKLKRMEGSKG